MKLKNVWTLLLLVFGEMSRWQLVSVQYSSKKIVRVKERDQNIPARQCSHIEICKIDRVRKGFSMGSKKVVLEVGKTNEIHRSLLVFKHGNPHGESRQGQIFTINWMQKWMRVSCLAPVVHFREVMLIWSWWNKQDPQIPGLLAFRDGNPHFESWQGLILKLD